MQNLEIAAIKTIVGWVDTKMNSSVFLSVVHCWANVGPLTIGQSKPMWAFSNPSPKSSVRVGPTIGCRPTFKCPPDSAHQSRDNKYNLTLPNCHIPYWSVIFNMMISATDEFWTSIYCFERPIHKLYHTVLLLYDSNVRPAFVKGMWANTWLTHVGLTLV